MQSSGWRGPDGSQPVPGIRDQVEVLMREEEVDALEAVVRTR